MQLPLSSPRKVVTPSPTCIGDKNFVNKGVNYVVVVLPQTKHSQSFIKLRLNHWSHMDYLVILYFLVSLL